MTSRPGQLARCDRDRRARARRRAPSCRVRRRHRRRPLSARGWRGREAHGRRRLRRRRNDTRRVLRVRRATPLPRVRRVHRRGRAARSARGFRDPRRCHGIRQHRTGTDEPMVREAIAGAQAHAVAPDLEVLAISPICFVATKLEAFHSRGRGDYIESHDLEDVLTVLAGLPSLRAEVDAGESNIARAVRDGLSDLVTREAFLDAAWGHFEGDAPGQARAASVVRMAARRLGGPQASNRGGGSIPAPGRSRGGAERIFRDWAPRASGWRAPRAGGRRQLCSSLLHNREPVSSASAAPGLPGCSL